MHYIEMIHFIRPLVLWALPAVLFIVWRIGRRNTRDDAWSKICDPHLLDAIKVKSAGKGSKWLLMLWPISIIAIIAIAGPAFRKMPTPVIKNQSALIIALDVSKSMLADDIKPNRLERAKFKINDMLDLRKDGQTALVVYSGDAFVVTPLTDDTETISLMLKAISPDIMPVQGSRADIALEKARDLLHQAGYVSGEVILITDGVKLSSVESVAEKLVDERIYTSVLAIGTKDGAPIPSANGFVKDKSGNIVIPKLQTSNLRQLASAGNGRFAQISGDSTDIMYLLPKQITDNNNQQANESKDDAFDTEKYVDEGPWLALLLVPLVALLFRKGILLSLFLVVGLQTPESSYALSWDDMWLNSDQQAAKQITNGDVEAAFEVAKSDEWKATAAYKNEDYKQASNLYNSGSADGYYNQGNALAKSGELEEALKAYEESLKLRAADDDTLYNKKQVEEALKKQQEQEQQNKDKQDKDNKDKDKKDQNKDNKGQQDQQDQKKQDQKNQDKKDSESENKDSQENQDKGDNPEQQKDKQQEQSEMTDAEKKKQQEEQKKLEKADKQAKEKKKEKEPQEVKLTPKELAEKAENKEAIEQWLRRIPDDPGGLLRRKFYYQYNQQNKKPDEQEDW